MQYQNWEILVSVAFYFGAKIICYTCRMLRRDNMLTSIPERSETEDPPTKWVPKKKHEVLKAKYKCLKKLFQIYDASAIGFIPEQSIEYADDTSIKRRRKRSHRTKTDACAGTTEIMYSGDITQYECEASATSEKDLKIKKSCSTQNENSKFECNVSVQSHASKSEMTSTSETNTAFYLNDHLNENNKKCLNFHNNLRPPVPYLLMNERRKLSRFQLFVQRIFGIRQDAYILSNDACAASDSLRDGRRRRGLRFRRLRKAKKIKSETDIKDMQSSAILSYVQSVQKSFLKDMTPRHCPIFGCNMISYGIINYNDHLNLCHFKDRKYFCHYCHEGFDKEYDKLIHENEHIGFSRLSANQSVLSTDRRKIASNCNTQTDPEVTIADEKLKKIVSFFDKITNHDELVKEIRNNERGEVADGVGSVSGSESTDKRTSSCMNIKKACNCQCQLSSNSHTSMTSHQFGFPAGHFGHNYQFRKQHSLHEDLERRKHKLSKFHSCDGIIYRPRRSSYRELSTVVEDRPRARRDLVSEDGRLNVRSIDSSSTSEIAYSTGGLSKDALTTGKSDESISCDSSTNIVYCTSTEYVKKPSVVEALVKKVRNYKWESGTKVIRV